MRDSWLRALSAVGVLSVVGTLALTDVGLTAGSGHAAVVRAAPETASDAPLRAGKRLNSCTANFLVQKNGAYMNLAAGHCGGVGTGISLGGTSLGTVTVNAFSSGTDAAAFTVAGGAGLTPSVFVSADLVRPVVGQATVAVGDRVCTRGASTGAEVCGTVRSVGGSATYLGSTVTGLVRVSLDGGPLISGDSGAPVYKVGADGSAYAAGIAVLADGTFTSISAALSATGTTLVTRAAPAPPDVPPPPRPADEPSPSATPEPSPSATTLAALASTPSGLTLTAPHGTPNDATSLGLPATVTVTTDSGDKNLPVTWDPTATGYDPQSPDEQTFTYHGVVQLPADVDNPSGLSLDVEATVTVLAAQAVEAPLASAPRPQAAAADPAHQTSGRSLAVPLAAAGAALVLTCAVALVVVLRRRGTA